MLIKIRYLNTVIVLILDELLMNLRNIYQIHCTYLIYKKTSMRQFKILRLWLVLQPNVLRGKKNK